MRKILYIVQAILLICTKSFGQADPIKESTYHFTIKNDLFIGSGADTLKSRIVNAQFFLIGEEHNMKELQDFTTSIIPYLTSTYYKYFALEIGPVAADKLTSIHHKKASLNAFNTYYYPFLNGVPFGFFQGKEEEQFSNRALEHGFQLWGLDFENYNSTLYILNELYILSKKTPAISESYKKAYQFALAEYQKDRASKSYNLPANLLRSEAIKSFFDMVAANKQARIIIAEQIASWKIYEQESKNNWYPRVENMKTNFADHYKKAIAKNALPKVFVKMGAVHMARGTSSSGFQEVGNLIYELSQFNRTKTFSVISFARYRIDTQGKVTDLLDPEDADLLKYTNQESWSLIDLSKLKRDSWSGKIKLSSGMQSYIQKFDMMLIPPATKPNTINYNP